MEKLAASKQVCPMNEQERFAKFYDVIPEIFRSYMSNFVWTIGYLTVANGWILSSGQSRDFIRNSNSAYLGSIAAVSIIGLLHTVGCWNFYQRSQKRIAQLTTDYEGLYPLPFQDYEISRPIFLSNLLLSWSLIVCLIVLINAAHTSLP
jgi:hypothetical protein